MTTSQACQVLVMLDHALTLVPGPERITQPLRKLEDPGAARKGTKALVYATLLPLFLNHRR